MSTRFDNLVQKNLREGLIREVFYYKYYIRRIVDTSSGHVPWNSDYEISEKLNRMGLFIEYLVNNKIDLRYPLEWVLIGLAIDLEELMLIVQDWGFSKSIDTTSEAIVSLRMYIGMEI